MKTLKKSLFPLVWFLALSALPAAAARADVVETRVFGIEEPAAPGREYQVLSTGDGRVYFASPADRQLLAQLAVLRERGVPVRLVLDGDRVIGAEALGGAETAGYRDAFDEPAVRAEAKTALQDKGAADLDAVGPEAPRFEADAPAAEPSLVEPAGPTEPAPQPGPASLAAARAIGYEPTILGAEADAQSLFATERELNHHSQCYERAEVWTRELEQLRAVRSMKVFMFFTSRFRNRFTHTVLFVERPYKWWFHVAPFVYVAGREYVLDREFMSRAVPMAEWTFQFIGKVEHDNHDVPNPTPAEAACLDAAAYTQFSADANPARYCVLRKVPMYYFQPLDVAGLDTRVLVSGWRDGELKRAYKDTQK